VVALSQKFLSKVNDESLFVYLVYEMFVADEGVKRWKCNPQPLSSPWR